MTIEQGGRVRWVIEADASDFDATLDGVEQKAADTASTITKSNDKISDSYKKTGETVSSIKKNSLLASTGMTALSVASTAAVGAMASLVSKGIQATDFLETARISMSGLTGSIQAGTKAMSIAANYWQNNPFQRTDVTSATQQLVQFGRTTKQLAGDLEILGNVSLSSGAPIAELARYFGRTAAAGRAMTLDIEMMSDRGIPIYRELAKQLKTTQAGVREMASQGKIDFETFRKALEGAVDADAMKEYENTLARQRDRFKGSISMLAGDLAGYKIVNDQLVISNEGLEKSYTNLLKTLSTGLRGKEMREAMAQLGNILAKVLQKVTAVLPSILDKLGKAIKFVADNSELLVPILGLVLTLFGRLGSAIPVIGPLIQGLSNKFGLLTDKVKGLISTRPLLAIFLSLFSVGLVEAYKTSEEFRDSIKSILESIGHVIQAIMPAVRALVDAFVSLAKSPAFISVINAVAKALSWLAKVISSIPTEILETLLIALAGIALFKYNKILAIGVAITTLAGAFKNLFDAISSEGGIGKIFESIGNAFANFGRGVQEALSNVGKYIANVFTNVKNAFAQIAPNLKKVGKTILSIITTPFVEAGKFLASLPANLATIGNNIMVGLVNGLVEGSRKIGAFMQGVGNTITGTIKKVLGIHSPSTVMNQVGQYITLGLAEGITNSKSVVQKAMDSLAKDVLSKANQVIQNRKDFGLINVNGVYKDWKKVSKLFTEGSEQYVSAIEKMEEARKQVNLEIVELQKSYNDSLDDSIDRLKTMYSMFEKVDTAETGMDAEQVITNLDKQVAKLKSYAASQEIISGLELDSGLIDELKALGVDSVNELQAIANMTSSQLADLNSLWLEKQATATKEATRQLEGLKNETLNQISELKDGIDGETVEVKDEGGRLVASFGDGVTGAIPTLESAYADWAKYLADATKTISKENAQTASEAGAENGEDYVNGVADEIAAKAEEFGQKIGDALKNVLIIGGGIALAGIGAKLLSSFGSGGGLSGIFGKIGSIFGGGKAAGDTISTTMGGVTKGAESITKASSSMSKASQAMGTIRKGLLNVLLLAVDIIAVAAALRGTYELLKDVDFGKLAAELGLIAGVVVAMGVIAYLGGKFGKEIGKGIIVILGLALDIAAVGAALGLVDESIHSDFDVLVGKLGAMGIAIGEFAVLAGVIGALVSTGIGALIAGAGLATLLGIAGGIAALGAALGEVDRQIPEDTGKLEQKVKWMIKVLGLIAGAEMGNVLKNLLGMVKVNEIAEIVRTYVDIAESLNKIAAISIDEENIVNRINKIGEVVKVVIQPFESKGVFSMLKDMIKSALGSETVKNVRDILRTYEDIIQSLNKISEFTIDEKGITDKVSTLARIIGVVADQNKGDGFWATISRFFNGGNIDESKVIKVRTIIAYMIDIAHDANRMEGVWVEGAETKIGEINRVLIKISEIRIVGDISRRLETVEKAKEVIGKFIELNEELKKLSDVPDKTEEIERIKNAINAITDSALQQIRTKVGEFKTEAENIVTTMESAIRGKEAVFVDAGKFIGDKFKDGVISKRDEIGRAAADWQGAIWNAIEPKLKDEFYQGQALANEFKHGVENVNLYDTGKNAAQGFINGIAEKYTGSWNAAYSAGYNLANAALQGIRDKGKEGSPWKTTFQSGAWAAEGLFEGIKSNESLVVNEAKSLADQVVEALDVADATMTPTLGVATTTSTLPIMSFDEGYDSGVGRRNVIIEQTNNNYTNYSIEQLNRDLAWQISVV